MANEDERKQPSELTLADFEKTIEECVTALWDRNRSNDVSIVQAIALHEVITKVNAGFSGVRIVRIEGRLKSIQPASQVVRLESLVEANTANRYVIEFDPTRFFAAYKLNDGLFIAGIADAHKKDDGATVTVQSPFRDILPGGLPRSSLFGHISVLPLSLVRTATQDFSKVMSVLTSAIRE